MMDTLAQLPVWQLWLIAAFFLFALEIVTPGFVLACFGMGALLAIPAALAGSAPTMPRREWMPSSGAVSSSVSVSSRATKGVASLSMVTCGALSPRAAKR